MNKIACWILYILTKCIRLGVVRINKCLRDAQYRRAMLFVMGGEVGLRAYLSVGGSEQVNPQVFKDFHYTALGHLHGPQRMGADHIHIVDPIKIFL